jgi:hypothetical protein
MMDAEDAVEAAAYALLNVQAVTDLAKVYQHVPENAPPPVLIVGDMTAEAIESKGGRDAKVALVIVAVIEAEERRPLRALKDAVLAALDGRTVAQGEWQLTFVFKGSDGGLDPETGEAYFGNFNFDVFAFAGD